MNVSSRSVSLLIFVFLTAVTRANEPPVAAAGSFSGEEDEPIAGNLSASDADEDYLVFQLVTPPAHGSAAVLEGGSFRYYPQPDFYGSDSFSFLVSDETEDSAVATVSLTVTPVNDRPVVESQSFLVQEDGSYAGQLVGTDVDEDTLTFLVSETPGRGELLVNSDGSFVYAPDDNFFGVDAFRFSASDGALEASQAFVSITVAPVEDTPAARPMALSTPQNRIIAGQLQAYDIDGDTLTYEISSGAGNGTASTDVNGRFTYTPNTGFEGSDSFAFTVTDPDGESAQAEVTILVGNDSLGFIGDEMNPNITYADFRTGALRYGQEELLSGSSSRSVLDQAVDRSNRRIYILTENSLEIFNIIDAQGAPELVLWEIVPVSGSKLALSVDGRTAYVGGEGEVTAINLYEEGAYEKGVSIEKAAYQHVRTFPFTPQRDIVAMRVHPAGDRLFVVLAAAEDKLNVRNDLLRSDVGNGDTVDNLTLPDDFGYITQLDIGADVQTDGPDRPAPEFVPAVSLKELIYPNAVALGLHSLTFSPDGNYALLSAVGAQTPRATPFGIMPTSDEGTGGIIVLDVRPRDSGDWVNYLGFIPTTEKGEDTAALRQEIRVQGWKTVHPEVQWARYKYFESTALVALSLASTNPFTTVPSLNEFGVRTASLALLEESYQDYGYMDAYSNLYPRDMVGASGIAINSLGDFGVVTMQNTNNLGLLNVQLSKAVEGFTSDNLPDFQIVTGTGKTINGFDPALTFANPDYEVPRSAYSWAYPQEPVFTSDDSRLFIGMAGGTPSSALDNRFGSADAFALRTEASRSDSVFYSANPPPGYTPFGGPELMSPRQAVALHSFDADGDELSSHLEAFNRWNTLRTVDFGKKEALVSTIPTNLSSPAEHHAQTPHGLDCFEYGYYIPSSGIGYRLNTFGMPENATNFATRGVVAALERLGVAWDKQYRAYLPSATADPEIPVTRPYFVVGVLSQPGGGVIEGPSAEALRYTPGNGSEASFPYFSIGSDVAHDFVISNGPDDPLNNSEETKTGFDVENTKALLRLLLQDARVESIALDPYVLDLIPEIRGDPRLIPHGSRQIPDSRRDMDNHIFVTFGCASVDLDIDSDNDGNLDQSPFEDAIEDQASAMGKFISPNHGDVDSDGIPDYADGYDHPDFPGQFGSGASSAFTEMKVTIPDQFPILALEFRLIYSESKPDAIVRTGSPPYTYDLPPDGAYRVWTRDGPEARLNLDINSGGDYVEAGKRYPVAVLHLVDRVATFYVESVNPTGDSGEREIVFELIPKIGTQNSVVALRDTVQVRSGFIDLAVDGNRDGIVAFDGSDTTNEVKKYRFWLNNDADEGDDARAKDLDPRGAVVDCFDGIIKSKRDLEDFSRLHIRMAKSLEAGLVSGALTAELVWKGFTGSPRINLFVGAQYPVSTEYLEDDDVATVQLFGTYQVGRMTGNYRDEFGTCVGSTAFRFPPEFWHGLAREDQRHLIFEAAGSIGGSGKLVMVLRDIRGNVVDESKPVWMDLKDIKNMYETFEVDTGVLSIASVGQDQTDAINDLTVADIGNGFRTVNSAPVYSPGSPQTDDYILFVHGWRMKTFEKYAFAETAFKRLWWQGYRGRFGAFHWPTEWVRRWERIPQEPPALTDPRNYSRSERKAFESAAALRELLVSLDASYPGKVRLMAHSMGNVVSSEALRIQLYDSGSGTFIHTYAAMQSATVANAYETVAEPWHARGWVYYDPVPVTPDVYSEYRGVLGAGRPYFEGIDNVVYNGIVNFHNEDDSATTTGWQILQWEKPDVGYDCYYNLITGSAEWVKILEPPGLPSLPYDILNFEVDTYEIFAHIAQARSKSLGSIDASDETHTPAPPISRGFDLSSKGTLNNAFTDSREDHSAQFMATNVLRAEFWSILLNEFSLGSGGF